MSPAFAYILGWASCALFIAACEVLQWLRERHIALANLQRLADDDRAASLTEMLWPLRQDEIRPDWVAEAATRGRHSTGGGDVVRLHKNVSSRLLSSGSEKSL